MRWTTALISPLALLAFHSASQAALPKTSLKSLDPAMVSKAADSAKMAAEASAKQKVDSVKAMAEAAKQKSMDSIKAKAAELEKKVKDSVNALMGKKTPPKPAAEAAAPKATVVEAKPEPTPKAENKGCSVTKLVFAAKVENREAVGEAEEFAAGQVACWSRIACGSEAMTIQYVWSKDGKQVYDIPISMKHSGRGWTRATVTPGKWKVTLMKDGAEIGSGEMTVK